MFPVLKTCFDTFDRGCTFRVRVNTCSRSTRKRSYIKILHRIAVRRRAHVWEYRDLLSQDSQMDLKINSTNSKIRFTFGKDFRRRNVNEKIPRDFLYLTERPPKGREFWRVTCLSARYRSPLHWITTVAGLAAGYHSSYSRFLVFDVR